VPEFASATGRTSLPVAAAGEPHHGGDPPAR
jgi:hypothetical protein